MIVAATGGGGMLGHALVRRLPGLLRWEKTACDVTDAAAVARCLDADRPDVLVHAAAWTDVDGCEQDPDRAHAVNAGAR